MLKIITQAVNNPIFIEIQYHTLKKYVRGDYEFIVFNDAKDFPDFTNGGNTFIKQEIRNVCNKFNIKCIDIPNNHHKEFNRYDGCCSKAACIRTEDALEFILNYQLQNIDKYLCIDGDMFLIDYFDTNKYNDYVASIVPQYRNIKEEINYFWNGIYYFDFNQITNTHLLNWRGIPQLHCDSGGSMKDWLKLQNKDTIYYIDHLISLQWNTQSINKQLNNKLVNFLETDPRNINNKYWCEIYDDIFLHYRAGGNWNQEGYNLHQYLSLKLKEAIINE